MEIELTYSRQLSNENGVEIIKEDFHNVVYDIDESQFLVKEEEEEIENSCELQEECDNFCTRCAGNDGQDISRIIITPIWGKKRYVFEAYSGHQIGDCLSDYYFVGVFNSNGEEIIE